MSNQIGGGQQLPPDRPIHGDRSDRYDFTKESMLAHVRKSSIAASLLYFQGHTYWIDERDSSIIFIPGGDTNPATTKIQSIRLFKPNNPQQGFTGKDLHQAARIYMTAYDVIGPAAEERGADNQFKSFYIDTTAKVIRGYVSEYHFNEETETYEYQRRGVDTGTEISTKGKDIFERIDKLKELKIESEKAFQAPPKQTKT